MRSPDRDFLAVRLCVFAFLINAKPSEPFLTLYLNQTKMLSEDQLSTQVFPYSTLGGFLFLLPMALLAEIVGCRAVVLLGLVCREATRVTLIFGQGLSVMAAMQLFYSAGVSADAIYFAFVYQVAPRSEYARLTALVLAAYHVGNTCAALVAQALVAALPAWRADLLPLFYCSWVTTTLALMAFWLLPPPRHAPPPSLAHHLMHDGLKPTCAQLKGLYAPAESRLWLCWFVLAFSGEVVVENYFQLQMFDASGGGGGAVTGEVGGGGSGSVDAVDAVAPFGLLEAAIEAGLAMGAILAPACTTRFGGRRPAAFVAVTSVARAVTLGVAAMAAQQAARGGRGNAAVIAAILNVLAATLHGLQRAVASSLLAARALGGAQSSSCARGGGCGGGGSRSGPNGGAVVDPMECAMDPTASRDREGGEGARVGDTGRFPILFGANTLLANGVSAALGACGAVTGWGANEYYWAVSAMLGALALVAPTILRGPSAGVTTAAHRLEEEGDYVLFPCCQ